MTPSRMILIPLFCQANSVCVEVSVLLRDLSTSVKLWKKYMWDEDQGAGCVIPVFSLPPRFIWKSEMPPIIGRNSVDLLT